MAGTVEQAPGKVLPFHTVTHIIVDLEEQGPVRFIWEKIFPELGLAGYVIEGS
jgi:hypothetical protein